MATTTQTQSCPCCGRAFRPSKAAAAVNPSHLSDADVFAYYKRIAPVEDVRFQLRLRSLPAEVRAGFEALLMTLESQGGKATPATKREYARLHQLWRETSQQRAPRVRIPAGRSGWIIEKVA
jgi:hypothetical protein